MTTPTACAQLVAEIRIRKAPITRLVGITADGKPGSVNAGCRHAYDDLCYSGDGRDRRHLSRDAATTIMAALWPVTPPPPEWWRTPLGALLAAHPQPERERGITHHDAATILGVSMGTVSTLVARGTIAKHPDGGLSLTAVLARHARLARTAT